MAVISQELHERYAIYHSDNMEILPTLKSESIGFSVYSPPFMSLYQYSNDPRDMSNCTTHEEGLNHYRFVVKEIHRLTKPGRISCVHAMDLKKGSYFQRDFPGDIVRVHEEAGFHFFCRITIWKDPWLIARRTRVKTLMHKSLVTGGFKVRIAGPDYVLVFLKGGVDKEPIKHPHGLKYYAGENQPPEDLVQRFMNYKGDQRKNLLSHWIWRAYASPVWTDIRTGRLLPHLQARESTEEIHACPLQLDVIDRCLTLWSNPGDVVLSPFAGVGSEVYGALVNSRRAVGIELKSTYFRQMKENIKLALVENPQEREKTLFDGMVHEEDVNPDDLPDAAGSDTEPNVTHGDEAYWQDGDTDE